MKKGTKPPYMDGCIYSLYLVVLLTISIVCPFLCRSCDNFHFLSPLSDIWPLTERYEKDLSQLKVKVEDVVCITRLIGVAALIADTFVPVRVIYELRYRRTPYMFDAFQRAYCAVGFLILCLSTVHFTDQNIIYTLTIKHPVWLNVFEVTLWSMGCFWMAGETICQLIVHSDNVDT